MILDLLYRFPRSSIHTFFHLRVRIEKFGPALIYLIIGELFLLQVSAASIWLYAASIGAISASIGVGLWLAVAIEVFLLTVVATWVMVKDFWCRKVMMIKTWHRNVIGLTGRNCWFSLLFFVALLLLVLYVNEGKIYLESICVPLYIIIAVGVLKILLIYTKSAIYWITVYSLTLI